MAGVGAPASVRAFGVVRGGRSGFLGSGVALLVNVRPRNAVRLALVGGAGPDSVQGLGHRPILADASVPRSIEIREVRSRLQTAWPPILADRTSA